MNDRTRPRRPGDPADQRNRNMVGRRELIALQVFDIARLTSHAAPIIPGTFIAVSGVGPKGDSNGSGKTSFLAAVSVLLADPQWRLDVNGGRLAAGLLFKPDAAGLDSDRVRPADHGYIVGLFADPADPTGIEIPLLTVWIRLSTTAPHLQVGWLDRMAVADADTDPERYEQAGTIWESIPGTQRCSARAMQPTLYGDAPRCMAYLDTTLRPAAASLLSQQMTEMSPPAIGQSLIDLVGLRQFLEDEHEQRGQLAEHQRSLSEAGKAHQRRLVEETAELAAVENRDRARSALGRGALMWRLHFARRYVEIVPQHRDRSEAAEQARDANTIATTALAAARAHHRELADRQDLQQAALTAKQRWEAANGARESNERERAILAERRSELARKRPRLMIESSGWDGTSARAADESLNVARRATAAAEAQLRLAEAAVESAKDRLVRTEHGRPQTVAAALAALDSARIAGTALVDTVVFSDAARPTWEPVLHPWLNAVVVPIDQLDRAAGAVSRLPGTILVTADPTPDEHRMPEGLSAGVSIGGFLGALAQRMDHRIDPDRAVDHLIGVTVIGGFGAPIAGRQAMIDADRAQLIQARQIESDADRAVRSATSVETQALHALEAARAGEQLAADDATGAQLDQHIGEHDERLEFLVERAADEFEKFRRADQDAAQHAAQVDAAKRAVERAADAATRAAEHLATAIVARDAIPLRYWSDGWGDTLDAAERFLGEQDERVRVLTAKRLRNRASEDLKEAFDAYKAESDDIPRDIREMMFRREDLADGDDPTSNSLTFEDLSLPLRLRLDGSAERDATTASIIHRERQRREGTIRELTVEIDGRTGTLEHLQGMIEQSFEGHFGRMSEALNTLDLNRGGFGAELQLVSHRPDSATGAWQWQVSPRWRRTKNGRMISYQEVANGAQVKVYAVQVTLAALLAAETSGGRVLVIDELGNSLGEVNRKDVLGALRQVAERQGVTIFGTCQDSVLYDAAAVCQEVLWFTHASPADTFNEPVRIWAQDLDQRRVEITADWMRSLRPMA